MIIVKAIYSTSPAEEFHFYMDGSFTFYTEKEWNSEEYQQDILDDPIDLSRISKLELRSAFMEFLCNEYPGLLMAKKYLHFEIYHDQELLQTIYIVFNNLRESAVKFPVQKKPDKLDTFLILGDRTPEFMSADEPYYGIVEAKNPQDALDNFIIQEFQAMHSAGDGIIDTEGDGFEYTLSDVAQLGFTVCKIDKNTRLDTSVTKDHILELIKKYNEEMD